MEQTIQADKLTPNIDWGQWSTPVHFIHEYASKIIFELHNDKR